MNDDDHDDLRAGRAFVTWTGIALVAWAVAWAVARFAHAVQ